MRERQVKIEKMSEDTESRIFFVEENKREILNKQIERYQHNEVLAEKFIRGFGITAGLSALSAVLSVAKEPSLIDTFLTLARDVPENAQLSDDIIILTKSVNIAVGTVALFVSLGLFFVCISYFWKVLRLDVPDLLIGKEPLDANEFRVQKSDTEAGYKKQISALSHLLSEQTEHFDNAFSATESAISFLVFGILLIAFSLASDPRLVGMFDFFGLIILITTSTAYVTGRLVRAMKVILSARDTDSDLTEKAIEYIKELLSRLFSGIFPLKVILGVLGVYSVLFVSLVGHTWWVESFKTVAATILDSISPTISAILLQNVYLSTIGISIAFAVVILLTEEFQQRRDTPEGNIE